MENTIIKTRKINYFNCNSHTVILMAIIVPSLIITGLIIKLIVYSEQNQLLRFCDPIDFFWGNTTVCKNFIKKTVSNAINTDSFKNITQYDSPEVLNYKNEEERKDFFNYVDLKKNILANYLAIIDFIVSLKELIILFSLVFLANSCNS
jgi:hypothetical protein